MPVSDRFRNTAEGLAAYRRAIRARKSTAPTCRECGTELVKGECPFKLADEKL
jgi:hypothetical protein